ncbi:MAG: PepSY domain-containing protein [Fimbriimonadaceae bacterium]
MFRILRSIHRVVGLAGSLCMLLLAVTGFFLALKSELEWMRPPTRKLESGQDLAAAIHPSEALNAGLDVGIAQLASLDDVDRFEYHSDAHVYKILSKDGYHEVQVDAANGDVLSVGKRNDQLTEDIHDLRFFHPQLRKFMLPVVAAGLFTLGVTGVVMYFVPVVRRWKYRRKTAA